VTTKFLKKLIGKLQIDELLILYCNSRSIMEALNFGKGHDL
jgi:hypothetical protein